MFTIIKIEISTLLKLFIKRRKLRFKNIYAV